MLPLRRALSALPQLFTLWHRGEHRLVLFLIFLFLQLVSLALSRTSLTTWDRSVKGLKLSILSWFDVPYTSWASAFYDVHAGRVDCVVDMSSVFTPPRGEIQLVVLQVLVV